ncbi:tripartite tricarboxylate transporter substrate binding protein [Jonesiaceae bacterium BS-20]|uniref:Tripartite tricarboxylate transporter substrate binding protein n=1 Tax=Jonesiaceae bacterium BS-20 TaxID=3120821 RepID=A0AAU7DUP8_9MICO
MRNQKRFAFVAAGVTAAALVLSACSGGAEEYPPGQVDVIVPWAAGGGSDQASRQLLLAAEAACDTRFVVSNRTGAAGATGHEAIAKAKPNGKTIGTLTAEATILPHTGGINKNIEDYTPIIRFAANLPAFVVKSDSAIETPQDLVEALNSDQTVRVGTTGKGGVWDIAAGGFEQAVGSNFDARVPYDGGAAIIQAILGDHVEVAVLSAPEAVEHVKSGDLRVIGIAAEERAQVLPDAPTLKESGIDWATGTWFGFAGPKDLSEEVVTYLEECLTKGYEAEEYQEFLANMGFNPAFLNSADFTKFIADENATFEELIPNIY